MADVNANIGVNIDTSDALNQLKNLQRQISQFHQSVAKSSSTAAIAQRDLQKNFVNSVNAIQGFSAELRTVRSTAESFTNSLEKNKFSVKQYFRYAAGATKTFGKNFTSEFATIERTAIERVKTLQTQYIKMGRDAQGAMQAIAIRPTVLNMKDLGTQTAIAAQKQVLFNQLIKQGSTNLLNFGKNTQWAGRQLMVGFTLPLATLGMTAGRVFMDMEKAAIKFKKVYGDLFTAPEETQRAMDAITELGLAYTKYGVAVSDSLSVAADAAAAGFKGVDLQNQTTASLKLSVLGQMELQKALETTIALQNAFKISSEDLNGTIDFLNAVENQTVVSLDDITEATPRVATVIQSLGGDVKDLAFFLAAMKEGGVNAAQGANALKSGLASLINPTERASEMLMGMGVNIRGIVSENEGDLRGLVLGVASALDTLDPTSRARAIEQLFGKFQFARISALFDNVIRDGSQASRVLDLAGSSLSDLASLSEKELGTQAASAMNKFTSSIERIKVALVPLGELFLEIATPFVEFGTKVLDAFNNLPEEMKKIIGTVITVVGGIGPVLLMTFGLINNGIANMIKFFATVRMGYLKMTGQAKGIGDETSYMTQEQLEATAAAASLDQAHSNLTQRFTSEKVAVDALRAAYTQAAAAGERFAMLNPGMMKPGFGPRKMAKGGVVTVGGRGNKDTEPALLTPGEAVIPAPMVKQYGPLIEGMIAGNIPGYAKGFLGMPKSAKSVSKGRDAAEEIYQMFLKSSYANTAPTDYGHQISPTTGHSFPIFGLGGVYQKGNKQVFVKPVLDEKAALAEMRSTEISRMAHGLEAPEQRIVVMRDPMDVKRQRKFLALESDLDPKFVNNQPMGLFNEEQYFRQLVASLIRVDKDLSGSNVYGNVVADAGPGGVFSRASGLRDYEKNLPSMEEQAMINLLGIKGGAKRAFAESTLGMMAGITPDQYKQRMLGEIQKVLPRLKQTIASFGLTNPNEVGVYDDMVRRLETGLGVDWSKFHAIHSAVKIPKPKAKTQTLPGYKNGVVSVPGPKGAGDVVASMLSPGEAVIPADMAKKYAPLIQGMVAGNIPGYAEGTGGVANFGGEGVNIANKASAKALQDYYRNLVQLNGKTKALDEMFAELLANATKNSNGLVVLTKAQAEQAAKANAEIKTSKPSGLQMGHLQGVSKILPSGERESGSFVRAMTPSQNKSLDQGGQYVASFIKEWNSVTDGLVDAVKLGGAEITDGVKTAAMEIDNNIRDIAVSMAEGGKVTDEILTKAANQALENAKARGGDSATAANALEKTKDMKVVLPATVDTLASSEALKPLREKYKTLGVDFANQTSNQLKDILLKEKFITPQQTSGGRTDYVTTELGAAATSRGAGSRLFRTDSDGNAVAVERFAQEEGSKTYLKIKEKIAKLIQQVKDEIGIGLDNASGANSPSVKIAKATENLVDGVEQTIVNSKDDVAKATEQMISPVTNKKTGPRRASSDPAVMAALRETQAGIDSQNIAAGNPRGPRRATRAADNTAPTEKIWQRSTENVSNFSNKISQVAFSLSSLTGIMSIFGADLGGILPIISATTGALFGLIEISRLLVGTKIAEVAATRLLTAAKTQGAVGDIASAIASGNVAKMFGTMFVKGRGVVGFLINIGRVVMTLAKSFGLIGLAITALTIGIPMILDALKKHEQKISGLGDAAFVAGEKLKAIANVIGFEPTRDPKTSVGQAADFTGASDQVVSGAIDVRQSESFKALIGEGGAYQQDLEALKNASVADAQQALNTLVTQLIATAPKDFDPAKIQQFAAAIAAEAGKTDLDLSIGVSLNPFEAGNAEKIISEAGILAQSVGTKFATSLQSVQSRTDAYDLLGLGTFGTALVQFEGMNSDLTAAANNQAASISAFYEQLKTGLINGVLTSEQYVAKTGELLGTLSSFPDVYSMEVLSQMLQGVGIDPAQVNNIKNLNDKLFVTNALLTKGATINKEDIDAIASGDKVKAAKARLNIEKQVNEANKRTADSVAKLQQVEQELENTRLATELTEYLEKAAQEAELKAELELLGYSAADAQLILNNEMLKGAFLANQAAGTLAAYNEELAQFKKIEVQRASVGGGGQKSPFQEAIDSLKEQKKEITSNINAYAKLRNAGFSVSEASELAADSTLAVALATQKVGSNGYNELISKIKQVKAAQDDLANSDPLAGTDKFNEAADKVTAYFDSQAALMEATNEAATATNRALIETLEDQIEGYNRQVGAFERDLDKIAEKENAINKAYDEKTKSLETVKKLNQDIINQQKSQLSIANALSQGDVSAAASAIQDARAQSAAAQGDAMGSALEAGRQAQLGAVTEGGKTRAQIEQSIKTLKEQILNIEIGSLRTAQDAVKAADDATESAIKLLEYKGLTNEQWRLEALKVEAAKDKALAYEVGVHKALMTAGDLVKKWNELNKTITTNHVINTVYTGQGTGSPAATADPKKPAGGGGGGKMLFLAKGGMVKPQYLSPGGFAKGTDTVPAMLTPGEFVVNRQASKQNKPLLESINSGSLSSMMGSLSQPVYNMPQREYADAAASSTRYSTSNTAESSTAVDNSVYNYNLSVKLEGSNLNPNDVANEVIKKIKQVDSQRLRNQVVR